MELTFQARMIEWRGPAPFFFLPVPAQQSADIHSVAKSVSYGWGVIPVVATIGEFSFATSLFPKDGGYLLPVKAAVRKRVGMTVGDMADITMAVGQRRV